MTNHCLSISISSMIH